MTDLTPRRFLTELYQSIDGHFTLFTIDRTTGQRNTAWTTTPTDLLLLAGAHPDDCCWFGVASRTKQLSNGQRGGAADCGQIGALWLDVDIAGPTHDKPGLPTDRKQASDLIRSYPLKPTVVIDTGAGYQPWWFLAEPVDNPAALLARWGATWAELAHRKGFTIDNVFDVARIMRLPGTRNTKPDVNQLVTINAADYGRRYGTDDIDEHTLEPPAPTYLIRSQPYIGPGRVGDAFNDAVDAGQVLEKAGWTYAHTTPTDGSKHYTRPGKDKRQGSSATVYSDGHTIVWTDATSLKVRRSYDALGLYAFLFHEGQWTPAIAELARQGYGKQPTDFTAPNDETTTTEERSEGYDVDVAVDGATFLLDEPVDMEARWGRGSEVLWAHGESLLLVGPPGVGKTTVAGQIIGALTGCWTTVLGYPMTPANRVLLLAMDRPRQVQRALRRAFGPQHRQHVHQHLIVRKGPLPADLGKKPELLYELALRYQADVIIIDSLKDAAVKITDDEVGGNVNRAIQTCNAHDIDVLALHHQRKGQGGDKPTSLEDVYGSTWITAGAGSVILLWGEAGSELVELTHLKQPSDPVGPFTVEHDHHAGTSTVAQGFDALAYLRMKGDTGATVAEAAQAEHGTAVPNDQKRKKTERRLKGLVHDGYATTEGQTTGANGQFAAARYYVKDRTFTVDKHRGQAPPDGSVDTTVDNRGQHDEIPAHTVDTTVDTRMPTPTVDTSGGYKPDDVRGVTAEEMF